MGSLLETRVLAGACDAELMVDRGRNTAGQGEVGGGRPSLGATPAWGQDRSQPSDMGKVKEDPLSPCLQVSRRPVGWAACAPVGGPSGGARVQGGAAKPQLVVQPV